MSYDQIGWQNKTSTATPINATNLNHMDAGIAANDAAIGTLNTAIQGKVDKVEGKGLSTNDFTDEDALKLAGIEDGAEVNVQADWDEADNTADDYIKNKPDLGVYAEKDSLWQDATATGNPVTIKTQSAQAAKSTELSMLPVQDLHGYGKPWVGGSGKNKWSIGNLTTSTQSGVAISLAAGSYTFSATRTRISLNLFVRFNHADSTSEVVQFTTFTGQNFTLSADVVSINYTIANFQSGDSITKIQIESGSTATSYEPYANICPITGRTGAKIWGSGKNLLPTALTEIKSINTTGTWSGDAYTINDVTFTVQTDGDKVVGINANGTASADATLFVYGGTASSSKDILFPGDVKISIGTANNGSTTTFWGVVWSTIQNKFVYGTEAVSGGYNMTGFGVRIKSGYNAQNVLFKPMIRLSDEDETFVPYVQGDSVTIPFGSTIYGGTLNVETGELTVDTLRVELVTLNWAASSAPIVFFADDDLSGFIGAGRTIIACDSFQSVDNVSGLGGARSNPNNSICGFSGSGSHRVYIRADAYSTKEALVAALDGVYACYKLATPTTTTLTSAQVNLIKGLNNISTDADGISLTYFADGESLTDADNRITAVLGDIAPVEGAMASQNYAVGDYLIFSDKFCKASAAIATGEALAIGTNLTQTTIGAELKAIMAQL